MTDFDSGLAKDDAGVFLNQPDLGFGADEAQAAAPGDSGGPLLIDGKVAGVLSSGSQITINGMSSDPDFTWNGTFGEISVYSRVSKNAAWIDAQVAPRSEQVPALPWPLLAALASLIPALAFRRSDLTQPRSRDRNCTRSSVTRATPTDSVRKNLFRSLCLITMDVVHRLLSIRGLKPWMLCWRIILVGLLACAPLRSVVAAAPADPTQAAIDALDSLIGLVLSDNGNLNVTYTEGVTTERLSLTGSASMRIDGQQVTLTLGDTTPGIILLRTIGAVDWTLQTVDASLDVEFSLSDLSITTGSPGLSVAYNSTADTLELAGDASVTLLGQTVSANMGTAASPGVSLAQVSGDWSLSALDIGIAADIVVSPFKLLTTNGGLHMAYDPVAGSFSLYGGAEIDFESDTIGVSLGSSTEPGIGLTMASGSSDWTVSSLNLAIVEDLTLSGFKIATDPTTGLGVQANFTTSPWTLDVFGDVTATIEGQSVNVTLGDANQPGLQLEQSFTSGSTADLTTADYTWTFKRLTGTTKDTISLADITIETDPDGLGIQYSPGADVEVWGGVTLTFDSNSIGATFRDAADPGLVLALAADGSATLDSLNIDVDAQFSMYDLSFKTDPNNGFDFQYNPATQAYEAFGGLTVTLGNEELGVTFGTQTNPGLKVVNGTLDTLDMSVTADFDVAGFTFAVPTSNPLTVTQQPDGTATGYDYTISGEVTLSDLWSTSLTLGTAAQPGLKIVDGKWEVDSLDIEIDQIPLGFATMEKVAVDYSEGTSGIDLAITLDVYIPELAGQIDATATVNNGTLADVALAYDATGDSEGIDIAETGVALAHIGVDMENIDQADFYFDGQVGLEFGGQLEFDNTTVTLIRVNGEVKIDSSELYINDGFYVAAYTDANGDWQGLLFDGKIIVDLNWQEDSYYFDGSVDLPQEPGLYFDAQLDINSAKVDALIQSGLEIPTDIPVFGGWKLASVDAGIRMLNNDSAADYAAGWLDLLGWNAGAQLFWNTGQFKFIDGQAVTDIQGQISNDIDSQTVKKTFSLPEGATAVSVSVDWGGALLGGSIPTLGVDAFVPCSDPNSSIPNLGVLKSLSTNGSVGTFSIGGETFLLEVKDTTSTTFMITGGSLDIETGSTCTIGPYPSALGTVSPQITVVLGFDTPGVQGALDPNKVDVKFVAHYPKSSISQPTFTQISTAASTQRVLATGAGEAPDVLQVTSTETQLPINIAYWMTAHQTPDATISLFLDDDASGYNGVEIASGLPYGAHDPELGGALQHVWVKQSTRPHPHSGYHTTPVWITPIARRPILLTRRHSRFPRRFTAP